MEWIELDDVNYVRYGHSANILGNEIILFGGNYNYRSRNDI